MRTENKESNENMEQLWFFILCVICVYFFFFVCNILVLEDIKLTVIHYLFQNIKEINISKKIINLIGYSYGAIVAFEMALQAEQDPHQHPEIQNIIFLEGTPNLGNSYLRLLAATSMDEALSDVTHQIAGLHIFTWQFSQNIKMVRETNIMLHIITVLWLVIF